MTLHQFRVATAIALLLVVPDVLGQVAGPNNLSACRKDDSDIDYRSRVTDLFAVDASREESSYRVLVLSSFEPEWVLRGSSGGADAQLKMDRASRSIWHANWVPAANSDGSRSRRWSADPVQVDVHSSTAPITMETFEVLQRLWSSALARAATNETPPGVDGTSYLFSDSQSRCGEVWSPRPDTQAGGLVTISRKLRDLIESPNDSKREVLETEIIRDAHRTQFCS